MKKKPMPEKQIQKSDITQMSVLATMIHNIVMKSDYGVCSIHPHYETRMGENSFVPGVLLQPWKFMELFGDDTEYEYIQDRYGDMSVITEVNGVTFYALINGMDLIQDGRLV